MGMVTWVWYISIFLFGVVVGSFLNVCILRLPKEENIVTTPSHCTACGKRLCWYELIPLLSYMALRGRCSGCKSHISLQYPLVEAGNGILWILVFASIPSFPEACLSAIFVSALLVLSIVDARIRIIPQGTCTVIFVLGIVHLFLDIDRWGTYILGFFVVSLPLYLIFIVSEGRGIGGGDIKLMAVCGLFLGWKLVLFSFFLACLLGSVIHVSRMVFGNAGRVLALGPYLSAGVFVALLWGERLIDFYISSYL